MRAKNNTGVALPDVYILCGGKGTRLRSVVSDVPKVLAPIGDKTFLDILIQRVFNQGFERIILGVGYMKEKIMERYVEDKRILFSVEEEPLGTGGAIFRALDIVRGDDFIAMNGDSLCDANLQDFFLAHKTSRALVSAVLTHDNDVSDKGSVVVDKNNHIVTFSEKKNAMKSGLVSAGIYALSTKIIERRPSVQSFSIEHDFFPSIASDLFYGYIVAGGVLDIGTPERYTVAKEKEL